MTRETKIGLLVGLAFIIVIGILLSDHLTSTTEPAQAQLSMVGPNTREGVTTIGRPTVPVTVEPPPAVEPRTPVVTVEEMRQPLVADPIRAMTQSAMPTQQVARANDPSLPANANDPLVQFVRQNAADLEHVGAKPTVPTADASPVNTGAPVPPTFKEYKAQDGDNLSKIAARVMGASTKANRDSIVRANPSLKDNPNKIIVGKTYLVPTNATAAGAAPTGPTGPTLANALVPDAPARPSRPLVATESGTYWYTVKENDNLWKIAADQLGSGNAYTAIKELNRDTLKGGDTVHTNMRLRLPAKPVATASARD